MSRRPMPFELGEMLAVDWIDTAASTTGDPKHAAPETRQTLGFYRGVKSQHFKNSSAPREKRMKKVLVISDTKDDGLDGQEGWTAIPMANVLAVNELVSGKKRWLP